MDFSNLLEALQNPEIYPEKPEKVELLQTHVSAIFIVGEHVYKVKKPVNFGFLDFTTLGKAEVFLPGRGCAEPPSLPRGLSGGGGNPPSKGPNLPGRRGGGNL